jgi:hypothetical protein
MRTGAGGVATMNGLPFDMLNRMTDKLVHVKANSGAIH